MAEAASVRVSVVVPVFNPGPRFDDLIQSLDRQSLATDEFEVVLCDDGSGQATRDRLAQVAGARANVRVLTLPHSGWPGTPRNHGIDAARGRYVFFADQDDVALRRGPGEPLRLRRRALVRCRRRQGRGHRTPDSAADLQARHPTGSARRRSAARAAHPAQAVPGVVPPRERHPLPGWARAAGRPPLRHARLLRREHHLRPGESSVLRLGEECGQRQLLAHRPRHLLPAPGGRCSTSSRATRHLVPSGTRCCATGIEARS